MYLPFARKWRPQNFDEIVGQEHIATILKNAIAMNRVHHAYLFTGPRGIGKTSTARILSKALNCEKGPLPMPCNKCDTCSEITKGSSLDVIEIDGASNRGIDEIRNLRETVKFSPSKGRYKIYIIDEVHMLTSEAFNALLKTLEEPPAHVKFIFATTEPHKLPATILSRCQRFDFRRIPVKDIVKKLQEIVKEEKLDIEEGVFLYIAKASEGSMRDAESILDQVSSFSKGRVELKDVVESLGMIEQDELFKCADLILKRDTKAALYLIGELMDSGKDAKQFLLELLEHFRNLMLAKVGASSEELIDLPKEAIENINKQAQALSQGDIFYVMSVITNSLKMVKQLLPERIVLELCMIKLTCRDSIASIEELISKLPEPIKSSREIQPAPVSYSKPEVNLHPERSRGAHDGSKDGERSSTSLGASKVPTEIEGRSQTIEPWSFTKKIQEGVKQVIKHEGHINPFSHDAKPSVDITRVKDAWPILVKAMAVKKMSVASYLAEGFPESVKGNTICVAVPMELNFHRETLEENKNKISIEETLSQILDTPLKLQFIASDIKIEKPNLESKPEEPSLSKEELKKKAPIIDNALNIFGGKILRSTRNA